MLQQYEHLQSAEKRCELEASFIELELKDVIKGRDYRPHVYFSADGKESDMGSIDAKTKKLN